MQNEALQLEGLECEEALMLVRMGLRKVAGRGSLRVTSTSATFHALLTQWSQATGHGLTPSLKPTQGQRWEVAIEVQTHA